MITLSDGEVTLRPWRGDDEEAVLEACQVPLIGRYTRVPVPYARADAITFLASAREAWESGDERPLAVVDPATDRLLGAIARFPPDGHRVEFGYWVAPDERRKGVATRALRLMTDWTLETTDLVRLEVAMLPENVGSARVAQGAGYEREGIRRAWALARDGRPVDVLYYVLIRPGAGLG